MDWLRELTADAVDDFDAFAENGRGPLPGARGCGGLRPRDPRARAPQVHDALGQDRDLLDGAGREPRSLWARPHPADPDLGPTVPGGLALSAPALYAQVAGAHALDPRQPARARPRRPRRRLAASGGRRPRAASPTASACACSTRAARSCCRRASPSASRRASCRSRRAPGSRRTAGRRHRGCANVLTDDRSAPCGATTYNTNLVEVAPVA